MKADNILMKMDNEAIKELRKQGLGKRGIRIIFTLKEFMLLKEVVELNLEDARYKYNQSKTTKIRVVTSKKNFENAKDLYAKVVW